MKIVHVARRFVPADWGGTETVILALSQGLQARGHTAEVVCTTANECTPREVVQGVPVTRVPYFYPYLGLSRAARERLDRKGGNPFSFRLLRHLLALPGLDLIHLHVAGRLGGIGRYVARRRRIPYVLSVHGGMLDVPEEEASSWTAPTRNAFDWGKPLGLWVGSRRVMRDAAAILCVGRRESLLLKEKYPEKRVIHLPNGVDARRFSSGDGVSFRLSHSIPLTARVVSCIARIDGQKNQALLVESLPALLQQVPDAHLLLVGSTTDRAYGARLQSRVPELGLHARVTIVPGLPGASPELVDAYHASDVFVLPSIHEPFGIGVLEAWAAGVPVVASRVGGISEFVEDGKDALLFTSNDREELIERLLAVLLNRERRGCLAEAGRARVRREFSWDGLTDRLVSLYHEVRGRGARSDA